MQEEITILKGVHPGIVLDIELKKRHIPKGRFAIALNEFPQTLGSITKGKRSMNTSLAMRIEHALGIEEGFFMILQVYYDIKEEKRKQNSRNRPDISKLRPILFWDTKIETIDWNRQKIAIIQRVFERGSKTEQEEIIRFYGKEIVNSIIENKTAE